MAQVIVVGGGLSGLSAAHTVLERGGKVVLLDKNPFLGGNSTKATSGINGALTKTQIKLNIQDSAEKFYDDTAHSARDLIRPELVKVLTFNSASAVEWLQEKFNLDLSLVSRFGGHSFPRTHRGKEKFPGMTITYALMEKLEELTKTHPQDVRIEKKARVTQLIRDAQGAVIGVQCERDGKTFQEFGPVILATGGYAADFAQDGLLKTYRPDIYDLPTTNGDWSTGDGLKMVRSIGGNTVDLEKVQVHPTGLVDPNEPDAKVKFLAAEALRGVGGILLDNKGLRFCDELGHRDYVTGKMWEMKRPPYRLILNSAAAKEIECHCKHYIGRGLMKKFANGDALAKEMGISVETLKDTFNKYNEAASTKKDVFGKKFFSNVPFEVKDEFYVSIVTPVLHYCMGGVEITPESQIKSPKGPIPGLFAAGELCGGVHGANRLGGSSLLGCVVFGRVSGDSAARYLFSTSLQKIASGTVAPASASQRLAAISSHLGAPTVSVEGDLAVGATITQANVSTHVQVVPGSNKLSMEISWNGSSPVSAPVVSSTPVSSSSSSSSAAAPSAAPASSGRDPNKEWTVEEVAKHNTEKDCWVIVNGQVLDVTDFLAEHPGGKKAILIYAGKDATEEFNMLHKPDVIEKYAPQAVVGKVKGGSGSSHGSTSSSSSAPVASSSSVTVVTAKPDLKPSNKESWNSGGTADILPAERTKATFQVEKLTNLLDGGPEGTKKRRFILSPLNRFEAPIDKPNMNGPELLREHVKHFMGVHEAYWDTYIPTREEVVWMTEYSVFSGSLMNHYGLFLPTLQVHTSDQQRDWWFDRARTMKIIGCYAQTELGHGSNVRGLRTIAEYDAKKQEFVLNTPTLQSMKWWPGTLGKVATHALVYAQLILDGKEYGVHSFMVQIRDENHKPLPGIELGDLGPKLGDGANDTGYMRMKDVRIPREFMLSRYQQVTPEGKYLKSEQKEKNAKLHYTTMIFTRGAMTKSAAGNLARACTIAARYSCVRKQGFQDPKTKSFAGEEKAIIDHQVQRYRVFRQIALAYAIKFTGSWMLDRFKDMDSEKGLKNVDALPEVAATSGGLKALCTFLAWQGIEDLRKCCGGNGYLMSSGVAPLAANYVWQTTAEGDWIILMLQTAGFLLKTLQNVMSGKKTTLYDAVSYLAPLEDSSFNPATAALPLAKSKEDFLNPEFVLSVARYSALLTVLAAGNSFQNRLAECGKFEEAFNACALEMTTAVRAHCFAFMMTSFARVVKKTEDKPLKAVLSRLACLFACSNIIDDARWVGQVTGPQMEFVKAATVDLLNQLRPDCLSLVDAFDIPDKVLGSTIGRYDGNIYESLYEIALRAPLNQKDPFDGYQEYLRPHLDLPFLKQGNKLPAKL